MMTETEYINATNLCKLRIAQSVLRDCLFMDEIDAAIQQSILGAVARKIQKLEGIVKCKPQKPKK